ncbi:MAG: sulfatase-like hydrolase/transferase, partial [Phycisphaerales bacterium]
MKASSILNWFFNKTKKIRSNKQWCISFLCLSILFLIILPEAIAWQNLDQYFNFFTSSYVLIYLLIVFSTLGLWYGIFNNYGLAWLLTFVPISLLALVNYMKSVNQSKPLFPWDILIVIEGLKAANSMADPRVVVLTVVFVAMLFLLAAVMVIPMLPKLPVQPRKRILIFTFSLLIILVTKFTGQISQPAKTAAPPDLNKEYHQKGFLVAFLSNVTSIPKINVENYSEETIKKIVSKLPPTDANQNDPNFRPNIIVFISESFFDLTVLPDVNYSQPINPCFQELKKQNHITWFSPVFGGQTANAEFEFITGIPIAFFSRQIVPYRLYCRREVQTAASVLSDRGYKTIMIHPYYRDFWSRNTVIPNLGFDEFISLE